MGTNENVVRDEAFVRGGAVGAGVHSTTTQCALHTTHFAPLELESPGCSDFENNWLRTDGSTDGRTDRRTDRPSFRDARTHLKTYGI